MAKEKENKTGKPEMRITDDERKTIKAAFQGNVNLLKLLRKIFLPEYDPNAPLGQTVDMWSIKDISETPAEVVKTYFMARRELILHIESQLIQLQILAETPLETLEEAMARVGKDSTK